MKKHTFYSGLDIKAAEAIDVRFYIEDLTVLELQRVFGSTGEYGFPKAFIFNKTTNKLMYLSVFVSKASVISTANWINIGNAESEFVLYNTATTYNVGSAVRFTDTFGNTNFFIGLSAIAINQSPETHPAKWLNISSASSSVTLDAIPVTVLEVNALITNSTLEVGRIYNITNADTSLYGGTSIFLEALTTNRLSLEGQGLFYNPIYDSDANHNGVWNKFMYADMATITGAFQIGETVTANTTATAIYLAKGFLLFVQGDWTNASVMAGNTSLASCDISGQTTPTFAISQFKVWGGKKWQNVTGLIGESIDQFTLDSNWEQVGGFEELYPYNYTLVNDAIRYDVASDRITYRRDKNFNEVETSDNLESLYHEINAIKVFQWGNDFDASVGKGLMSNKVLSGSVFDCLNFTGSYIVSNDITQFSLIQNNVFGRSAYLESNTIKTSTITDNTCSRSFGMTYNTFNAFSYINSLNCGQSVTMYANTFDVGSIFSNSIFSNSSLIRLNKFGKGSQFTLNKFNDSSEFRNNILETFSYFVGNQVGVNSNVKHNCLKQQSVIQYNTLATFCRIEGNNLDEFAEISANVLHNNAKIDGNTLGQFAYFTANTIKQNAIFYSNTLMQEASVTNNTLELLSSISNNSLHQSASIANNNLSQYADVAYNSLSIQAEIIANVFSSSANLTYNSFGPKTTMSDNNIGEDAYMSFNSFGVNCTFTDNIFGDNGHFRDNTIVGNGGLAGNIFAAGVFVEGNTIGQNAVMRFGSSGIITKDILSCNFIEYNAATDISAATYIYQSQAKNIIARQDGVGIITYWNNSNVQVVQLLTS